MIAPLTPDKIPELISLLYEMWEEQSATRQEFNDTYLYEGIERAINNLSNYVVLTTAEVDCCLIAHVSPTMFFPDKEGFEDIIYIRKDKRGTSRFFRLLNEFEKFCEEQGAIVCRVGCGAGIMDDRLSEMYIRAGYTPVYKGFKKEIKRCAVVEVAEQL